MRNVVGIVLRAACWLVAVAIALAVFGVSMIWVTRWMWELIVHGGPGWKDELGRGIAAVIVAPIVGMGAGIAAAAIVGAPLYGILRLIRADDLLLRRRRASTPMNYPTPGPFPPLQYPPPPPTQYPPPGI